MSNDGRHVKQILVVDDNGENLDYLQTLLGTNGTTVVVAANGAEALAKGRRSPPDMVISDLLMPVMDGYTLLRLWKADEELRDIPFVVYTATYTSPEDEELAMRLGADAFILKPVQPEEFLERIRSVESAQSTGPSRSPRSSAADDHELLQVYNRSVVRKLEEKMRELEEANRKLKRDFAQRAEVEDEVRWKTALLEAQVESALDGILVVDADGRQILKNHRFLDLWEIPAGISGEIDDEVVLEYVTARTKNPGEFLEKVRWLYEHPEEISRDEIELVDETILDRYSSPVQDKSGRYYGRIWVFRDITEQRKLEGQFRQAQKMEAFGQLAGGVAHDFNNILAVVQLQAGLLMMESGISTRQREAAEQIEKAAERASNLTRQLLLFSRRKMLQARDLDLKEAVNNLAKMLLRTLGEHIELSFELPDRPVFVHADPGMLDQILLNLTVNARDAMPKGGQIVIRVSTVEITETEAERNPRSRAGSFAALAVRDNGSGIDSDVLPRIFEPFFTTKEHGKGTGLGLATVFGIVQQHQGWIEVESEPGRGSTFNVYLPLQVEVTATGELQSAGSSVAGGTETILLVEDQLSVRRSIRTILTRLGYHLLEAASTAEAIALWTEHREEVDLLLTDLLMPGGFGGIELAARFVEENPQLRVVYVSGYRVELSGGAPFLEEGVNFLTKPFNSQTLARVIRANLDGTPGASDGVDPR